MSKQTSSGFRITDTHREGQSSTSSTGTETARDRGLRGVKFAEEAARLAAAEQAALERIGTHGGHQNKLTIKRKEISLELSSGKITKPVEDDKVALLYKGGLEYPDYYDRGLMSASTKSDTESFQLDLISSSRGFLQACQEYHEARNPSSDSTSQAIQDNLGQFPISENQLNEVIKAPAKSFFWDALSRVPDTALMLRSTGLASAAYEWIKDALHLPPWSDNALPTFLTDATQKVQEATYGLRPQARGEQPYSDQG